MNQTRILGRARGAVLAEGFGATACASLALGPHVRHAAAVYVALDGQVSVHQAAGPAARGRAVAVPAHRLHALRSAGPVICLQYEAWRTGAGAAIQQLMPLGERLARRFGEAAASFRGELQAPETLAGLAAEAAGWLAQMASPGRAPIDRRVAQVAAALIDPEAERPGVVQRAGVSPAHLRELFARDIGVPMRAHQLWHRLLLGLVIFARQGATTAAHAVGFADLAHFSRTCRRMLGASPIQLARSLVRA